MLCKMIARSGVPLSACNLISRVDNLVQLLGQFVDLKFRLER